MKTRSLVSLAAAVFLSACGSDSDSTTTPPPGGGGGGGNTGRIAFRGNTDFTAPHPNQPIRAALVRTSDGAVLDIQKGTVGGALADPAFLLTFTPTVDLGATYRIRYWVDHNGNGQCDLPLAGPVFEDHQWETADVTSTTLVSVNHTTSFTSVCPTLSFQLAFRGDTTINGPHVNDTFRVALVAGGATTPLERLTGTVAGAGIDPAFLVTFTPRLFVGDPYSVKLYMEFNATPGCQYPADHQWSVPVVSTIGAPQPLLTLTHGAAQSEVCPFFP